MKNNNFLSVSDHTKINRIQINCKNSFFNHRLICEIDDCSISFTIATISDFKNVRKPSKNKNGFYNLTLVVDIELDIDSIERKRYYFDEESNEDTKIVYYN